MAAKKSASKTPTPVSVRFTRSEKRLLRLCSAKKEVSMSRYIREQVAEALRRDTPEAT